jgi:hypothetical protein
MIHYVHSLKFKAPYNLRLITTQLACNLVAHQASCEFLLQQPNLLNELKDVVSSGLLDAPDHPNLRTAAACLTFNIAAANQRQRVNKNEELLPVDFQVELLAPVVEALTQESQGGELLVRLVLTLGMLVHLTPVDDDLWQLALSYELPVLIASKKKEAGNLEAVNDAVRVLGSLK